MLKKKVQTTVSTHLQKNTWIWLKAGIVDPAKVTRSALQNATSVASTFLTTEAVVADFPDKNAPAMPAGRRNGRYDVI